jgi:hypothetical protein
VIWRSSQKQASRMTWTDAWSFYLCGEGSVGAEGVGQEA